MTFPRFVDLASPPPRDPPANPGSSAARKTCGGAILTPAAEQCNPPRRQEMGDLLIRAEAVILRTNCPQLTAPLGRIHKLMRLRPPHLLKWIAILASAAASFAAF